MKSPQKKHSVSHHRQKPSNFEVGRNPLNDIGLLAYNNNKNNYYYYYYYNYYYCYYGVEVTLNGMTSLPNFIKGRIFFTGY
jgi:hypothetical protein